MTVPWRRLASLGLSVGLLVLLYRSIDVRGMSEALLGANRLWVALSVAMILPITMIRAARFLWIAPAGSLPGFWEALRLTFVSSAVNLVAPAKSGDLVKSYFVAKRGNTSPGVAIAVVVYERLSDLLGLSTWCVIGYLVARPQVPGLPGTLWLAIAALGAVCGVLIASEWASALWRALTMRALPSRVRQKLHGLVDGWPDLLDHMRGSRRWMLLVSLVLWFTHLSQIWLFTIALSVPVPFAACAALTALALLAGQVPFTFAGLGTRDVALVILLSRYMAPPVAAALGLLMSTRNFLPPLVGIPMMTPFLSSMAGDARQWRNESTSPSC